MEYTSKLFVDFLKKLIVFDKDSQSAILVASRVKTIVMPEKRMNGVEFALLLNSRRKISLAKYSLLSQISRSRWITFFLVI